MSEFKYHHAKPLIGPSLLASDMSEIHMPEDPEVSTEIVEYVANVQYYVHTFDRTCNNNIDVGNLPLYRNILSLKV